MTGRVVGLTNSSVGGMSARLGASSRVTRLRATAAPAGLLRGDADEEWAAGVLLP